MQIYTKTGDKGTTSLIGGERVVKSDSRIEAYGTVDELSAFIGLLYDSIMAEDKYKTHFEKEAAELKKILCQLMDIEALFAADSSILKSLPAIEDEDIKTLELSIDRMNQLIPKVFKFTLPCGHPLISTAHICRTVCRRSERVAIKASVEHKLNQNGIIFLNRLSDYLYTLSRYISISLEIEEVLWEGKSKK